MYSGRWTAIWRKKKASTAFASGCLVDLASGFVAPSVSTTGGADLPVLGVYEGPAISSGSATTTLIQVWVPIGPSLIYATTTASIAATDEGKSLDMSDSVTVHASNTTYGPVTLVKFLSATEGLFAISKSIYANVA